MSVLERIRSVFRTQQKSLTEQYQQMVGAVASDDDYDAEAGSDVLMALHKTDADLARDAERLRHRREDAEIVRKSNDAKRELLKLDAEAGSLVLARDAELKAIHEKYQPKLDAIEGRRIEANSLAYQDTFAIRRLAESADPAIDAQIQVLAAKRGEVTRAIESINENVRMSDVAIETEQRNVDAGLTKPSHERAVQMLAGYQKRKQERLEQRAELQEQYAELSGQIAELDARKLLP